MLTHQPERKNSTCLQKADPHGLVKPNSFWLEHRKNTAYGKKTVI